MPAGDRTGPLGMGPMSGRGAGKCAGFGTPGYMNPMPGRGSGMGVGRGRGFSGGGRGRRCMSYATGLPGWRRVGWNTTPMTHFDPGTETQVLKNQAEYLQNELDSIRKRLEEIDKETGQQ